VSAVQLLNFQCFNTDLNPTFRQFCQIHSLQSKFKTFVKVASISMRGNTYSKPA
jgi:hypothetical protein